MSLAFTAATFARLGIGAAALTLNDHRGSFKILFMSLAVITCMYYFDLYDSSILGNRREVLIRLFQVVGTMYSLLVLLYYLYPPLELGRGISVIGLLLVAMLLFLGRRLFSKINSVPEFADRTLILGDGPLAEILQLEIESRPELGLRVVSRLSAIGNGNHHVGCERVRPFGDPLGTDTVEDLSRTVKLLRANRIVVAMGDRRGKLPVDVLLSLKCRGLRVQDGVEVYEAITGRGPIESIRLGWLLFSPGCHASRFHLAYKRAASIMLSILGLVALPLLPFIILAIKLTSAGPALYRQKRVGRDGVVFNCYKFRTMVMGAHEVLDDYLLLHPTAAIEWQENQKLDVDPRITSVGRMLRQTSLDEVPQLLNVLRGEMSLVGPRPVTEPELARYGAHAENYLNGVPGITGLWQVSGRNLLTYEQRVALDMNYLCTQSLWGDFIILLKTVKVLITGDGK